MFMQYFNIYIQFNHYYFRSIQSFNFAIQLNPEKLIQPNLKFFIQSNPEKLIQSSWGERGHSNSHAIISCAVIGEITGSNCLSSFDDIVNTAATIFLRTAISVLRT